MADEEQNRAILARAQNQRSVSRFIPGSGVARAAQSGSASELGTAVLKEGGKRAIWYLVGVVAAAALPLLLPLLGIALVFGIFLTLVGIL